MVSFDSLSRGDRRSNTLRLCDLIEGSCVGTPCEEWSVLSRSGCFYYARVARDQSFWIVSLLSHVCMIERALKVVLGEPWTYMSCLLLEKLFW